MKQRPMKQRSDRVERTYKGCRIRVKPELVSPGWYSLALAPIATGSFIGTIHCTDPAHPLRWVTHGEVGVPAYPAATPAGALRNARHELNTLLSMSNAGRAWRRPR